MPPRSPRKLPQSPALTAVHPAAGAHDTHKMNFTKFLKFWFPVIFYSAIIFCLSGIPNLRAPLAENNFDKVIHLGEYLILGILGARALTNTREHYSPRMVFWAVFLFCLFYGITDEFHQSFVAGRVSDWKDALADTLGGSLGGWLYLMKG